MVEYTIMGILCLILSSNYLLIAKVSDDITYNIISFAIVMISVLFFKEGVDKS